MIIDLNLLVRDKMKIIFLVVALFLVFGGIDAQENNTAVYLEIISFKADSSIFPRSWVGGDINAQATKIDSSNIDISRAVLIKCFNKYPHNILTKYLNKVYVSKTLRFYDLPYGGTNSSSNVYLINRGFSYEWLEMAFHAEFSSLLLRRNPNLLDMEQWALQNDTSIVYGKSGVDALQEGETSILFTEELNQKGILYPYATSSIENDFNAFAENILLNRKAFWDIAHRHPKIMNKAEMVMSFYAQISPDFDFKVPGN